MLARQGVEAELVYPVCCGMPQLEAGDLAEVAQPGRDRSPPSSRPWIDQGYDVVALTASCGLMMKFEWPLILPENAAVQALCRRPPATSANTSSTLAKAHGLAPGLTPVAGGVTLHHACHARAQNMGAKSAEMLRLIPGDQGRPGRALLGPRRHLRGDEGDPRRSP